MTDLELQDALARIKRAQAETDKFVDEGRKLRAESDKLFDEGHRLRAETWKFFDEGYKLRAEARKFERERELQPWQVFAMMVGSAAALLGAGGVIGGLIVRLWIGG